MWVFGGNIEGVTVHRTREFWVKKGGVTVWVAIKPRYRRHQQARPRRDLTTCGTEGEKDCSGARGTGSEVRDSGVDEVS